MRTSPCIRVERAGGPPDRGRRHARVASEGVREMALVREARGQGDVRQRGVRSREAAAGELDAELADVVAQRAAVKPAEDAGQMSRVDADRLRDAAESQGLAKPRPHQ